MAQNGILRTKRILCSTMLFIFVTFVCLASDEENILHRIKKYEASHASVLQMSAAITAPILVHRVDPKLPQTLPANTQISGVTIVLIVVTEKGDVKDPVILRSQYPDFDRALLDTIAKWKYRPAVKNDKPVSVFLRITHNIMLR